MPDRFAHNMDYWQPHWPTVCAACAWPNMDGPTHESHYASNHINCEATDSDGKVNLLIFACERCEYKVWRYPLYRTPPIPPVPTLDELATQEVEELLEC